MEHNKSEWFRDKSIFVTGGSGFIGTALVSRLQELGARITNFDVRAPNLKRHEPYWVKGDLLDSGTVRQVLADAKPELVFNLAAETDISRSADALLVNTVGVRNLLGACKAQTPTPQLVHFSTQLTVEAGYVPTNDEDMKPYTAYGESKAESERIVRGEGSGLVWTIVRPTTVWGPRHPTMPSSTWKYISKRWYLVPAGRAAIRSYGYVDNVVDQVLNIALVQIEDVSGRVFYVGDAPCSSVEWLDAFSEALTDRPTRRVPFAFLYLLALGGEVSAKFGGPSPINLGRLERMSRDHPVPMESTFEILGVGRKTFRDGLNETVKWLTNKDASNAK